MHPTQIKARKLAVGIAWRSQRLLQPGGGLRPPFRFNKIGANVIVGIAKGRVQGDGLVTRVAVDRLFVAIRPGVDPAQKRVRFGAGAMDS